MATNGLRAIREGLHTITPHIVVSHGAARAIEFYRRAFGAEETTRMTGPNGRIWHAELRIGDACLFLADEEAMMGTCSRLGGRSSCLALQLTVPDADAAVQRAVEAGATVKTAVTPMFWGARYGQVIDPFGFVWSISSHSAELSDEELQRRARAAAINYHAPEPSIFLPYLSGME